MCRDYRERESFCVFYANRIIVSLIYALYVEGTNSVLVFFFQLCEFSIKRGMRER
jgi:hypothetical protein